MSVAATALTDTTTPTTPARQLRLTPLSALVLILLVSAGAVAAMNTSWVLAAVVLAGAVRQWLVLRPPRQSRPPR